MAIDQAVMKKMVRELGRTHGWLRQHSVETMYNMGQGHGMGEANPDPAIQAMVSTSYADDLYEGFQEGIDSYKEQSS